MASDRSCRLTADQARELFRNLHDEESEIVLMNVIVISAPMSLDLE